MSGTKVSGDEPTQALSADASGELPSMGALLGGRYELLGLLGVGGMGSVYRARDVELDEVVAVKMIGRDLLASAVMLERFRQEVKLARRVTHRNVARMFDIDEHEKLKFLTMEFIDGESLADVLEREPILPIPRLAEVVAAICAGLDAAHEAGVVHRDLKPDNVMIAKDGRVLITDFGIARAMVQSSVRTQGMPVGTPAYMAPEQVEGSNEIDARADIYALGVMMYEMTVGAPPFDGESMFAVAAARLIRPPPNPQDGQPSIPDVVAKVIVKCMQRRKEDRYSSANEVAAALDMITMPALLTARRGFSPPVSVHSTNLPSALSEPGDGRKIVAVLPFKISANRTTPTSPRAFPTTSSTRFRWSKAFAFALEAPCITMPPAPATLVKWAERSESTSSSTARFAAPETCSASRFASSASKTVSKFGQGDSRPASANCCTCPTKPPPRSPARSRSSVAKRAAKRRPIRSP